MRTADPETRASILVAAAGLAVYLGFLLLVKPAGGTPWFGMDLYDEYYRAILDVRLQISARVLRYEGHYLPDGTGFAYYGLAPLVPRFLLGWLLPTDGSVFPFLTLFVCGAGSAALLHRMTVERARAAGADRGLLVRLGIACWFAAPGIMMVANKSVYWEPIAVAFLMAMLFIYALHRGSRGDWGVGRVLMVGALCAAVALHARPHVAVGICAGLAVVGIAAIVRRQRWFVSALAGVAIIAVSAAGLWAVNEAKFGSAGVGHASFAADAPVRYGTVFLGGENPESDRARAFEEHGRIDPARIPGHLLAHAIIFNQSGLTWVAARALEAGEPLHGYSRLEWPLMGFLFLFTPWIAIAVIGRKSGRPTVMHGAAMVAGAVLALLLLSYPTITFRYRVELFPILFALALSALPAFVTRMRETSVRVRQLGFLLALWVGVVFTVTTSYFSHAGLLAGGIWAPWSMEDCLDQLADAGLSPTQAVRSCDP